ncbi:restriction endonuclease subunit S [Nocardia aurea]|uniref:restriction endonuclease subunit S n=1 Tax=Nocardia aurea TaxID=2144174 RepID=UPI0033AD1F02
MTQTTIAPWLADSRWPTVPIRLVAKLGSGHTPSRSKPEYWEDCTVPWFTLADVWQIRNTGLSVVSETKEKISHLGLANSAAVLHPADTVILSRTASVGFSAIMGKPMATSQDFATWRCGPKLIPQFLLHALRGMTPDLKRVATGSTHKTIYMPDIEQLHIPLPSIEEQRHIASYLDAETSRIEQLLATRRSQISILENREASIIAAKLSDTIASDTRVKFLVSRLTSGPRGWGELVADHGSPFLRITNIPRSGISLDLRDLLRVDAPEGPERERTRTRAGDVLVSITADIGSIAVVNTDMQDANVSQHIALLRPRLDRCFPQWLAYALKSARSRQQLATSSYGGTKVGLGLSQVADVAVPSISLEAQKKAAMAIDVGLARNSNLANTLIDQIRLLTERRQALITAAVTGQFDISTASGRNITQGV